MTVFIILPTQLYPRSKTFWKQWEKIVLIEDPHYVNKHMHPLKLWMHRASMLEYYDSIDHKSKLYVQYDKIFNLDIDFTICHPTDEAIVKKYKHGTIIDTPGFILKQDELQLMDTSSHDAFYKRMRSKLDILMDGNKPIGDKWSYDESNRKRYPHDFKEANPLSRSIKNKYITQASPIKSLSVIKTNTTDMIWPTNRKRALIDLREFVKYRLTDFGPFQDAIRDDIVVGNHSCISVPLNIGLITPLDVIKESMSYEIPIQSIEALIRQIIGWREYIRMKYVLHGLTGWSHLNNMNKPLDNSWYSGTTGIAVLDWSIKRVLKYSYASHIERLMLLVNYAVLLRLKYEDVFFWFRNCFCDGYDWVMLNVTMGVNGLSKKHKFMKRAYLTNGTYLKKMGLKISKEDEVQLRQLYNKFIKENKELAKRDYRLAAAVKRLK